MDENEGISRRDALIGVSFLTLLMTAFMATMAYRIVDSQPRKGPSRSQIIATLQSEPADVETNVRSHVDDNVQTASAIEPAETAAPARPERSAPHFVAPTGR